MYLGIIMQTGQILTQSLHKKKKPIVVNFFDNEIEHLEYSGKSNRLIVHFRGVPNVFLRWTPTTNRKIFEFVYWFNNKTKKFDLGVYSKNFKTAECKKIIDNIIKRARDPYDPKIWLKDPKDIFNTSKIVKNNKSNDVLLKDAIEKLVIANYPRKKIVGNLSAFTQREFNRFLIGYNERTSKLYYEDNQNGWGVTTIKKKCGIESFEELFKTYPPGVGRKNTTEISLYDHSLGQVPIREISSYELEEYLNEIPRSYGQKNNILKAYNSLFNFAKKEHLLGKPIPKDPTKDIELVLNEEPTSKATQYNDDVFDLSELRIIDQGLIKLGRKRPMQVEAIMFLLVTGIRIEECCKLKWTNITKDENGKAVIKVPKYIIKGRSRQGQRDENIYIEPNDDGYNPIARVLDRVNRHRKRKGFHKFKHIPYIFGSPRADPIKLLNTIEYPDYAHSKHCRISARTLNDTWRDLKKITGINHGSIKTLRKTFISNANEILGGEHESRHLTRHKTPWINVKNYDKRKSHQVREMTRKVNNVFSFKRGS